MTDERIRDIWNRSLEPGERLDAKDARYLLEVCCKQNQDLVEIRKAIERIDRYVKVHEIDYDKPAHPGIVLKPDTAKERKPK